MPRPFISVNHAACLALLLLASPRPGRAAPLDLDPAIAEATAKHLAASVDDRRWFHQNPELGNREHKTAARVAQALAELGLQVETGVGVTGVLAVLDTGRPGPTVGIRADMDGLPVMEPADSGNPVVSKNPGVMHACGHDLHMTCGLGAARVLAEIRDRLSGKVLFVFQPAEEGIAPAEEAALKLATGSDRVGADRLVHLDRVLERHRVQAMFGLHGFPEGPAGTLGLMPEYALASSESFELEIRGRSAHAGTNPWSGSDVLHIAAGVVLDLHALPARQTDPRQPKVVSVSMLQCTDGRSNILCRTAKLTGTVRTFRAEDAREIRAGFERILDGAVKARDPDAGRCREGDPPDRLCWAITTWDYYGPPVHQNLELLEASAVYLRSALGEDQVRVVPPSLGGEDFAYYCEQVPCAFYFLGTAPPGGTGGLHTPRYAPDESAIAIGIRALAIAAARYLNGDLSPPP